ncbi:MAG: hypothetical protein SF162_17355 [bacterium]|nr:hypothetical protein [bacterium]
MIKQYRAGKWRAMIGWAGLLIMLLVSGCEALQGAVAPQEPTATPRPWAYFRAEGAAEQMIAAGLPLQNLLTDLAVGRGAPLTFNGRVVFEVPRIAPGGGQIVTFSTPEDLQAWEDWIADLRNDPEQRRSVVYVYVNQNALMQLSADLTNQEAAVYRDVFLGLQ